MGLSVYSFTQLLRQYNRVTVKCTIQLVEIIVFTEATVVKTTEAAASVASNVATALAYMLKRAYAKFGGLEMDWV